ncbi:hypothetical protein HBI56_180030 [Parastagonospora nodorum]|uniref:Uncharacterized protein n=1 Tax=Phaeosphaeria nodorum (strain SN15 / ATCC MYA-4574 / FGSC 10173) TaxID=321614 RepID=A0A7U2I5Z2_PHANO|nr:hypothetical protein HBH56_185460 [Parastagonospora nodorum]QRD01102.1 hypothetical protein JI435_438890 [Parastagonospora nodorum SN15]KAH3925363.1 hypothetical protein HBH54_183100 [Parastagonospora nodorum]KAH3940635.1 hypothetical protein HBH53_214660 [Parastagonospora nodorum]KAH3958210.1 hypothetical protein HBH51_211720 [Parastagonospora nodorum]
MAHHNNYIMVFVMALFLVLQDAVVLSATIKPSPDQYKGKSSAETAGTDLRIMAALEASVGAGAATMASGAGPLSTPIQMATGLLVMSIPTVILQGLLAVSLVTAMHAGVILDYEQQRLKRERQADFEMQHADLPQPALLNDLQFRLPCYHHNGIPHLTHRPRLDDVAFVLGLILIAIDLVSRSNVREVTSDF